MGTNNQIDAKKIEEGTILTIKAGDQWCRKQWCMERDSQVQV
jgi:hypothetical protein